MVGEAHNLLLTQDLQCPADVDIGKSESLADMALVEGQHYDFTRLGWKPAAQPDVDLEQKACDALPRTSQSEVDEMVVGACLVSPNLAQSRKASRGLASRMASSLCRGNMLTRTVERHCAE